MDRTSEVVEDGSDLNFDETAAGIDVPGIRRSTRVRVPTERGLDYQLPLRKKNYNQCKKKLEDKLNALDMSWTELSDAEALRKERTFIEDYRKALTEGSSEFVLLLPSEYANDVARETDYLNRQAMELRKRIGERIFELEKVELRSRRSGKTSSSKKSSRSSKHSSASQISLMKIKTMTELAKRKVEMQYARIEAQKQMEMQRKKFEIEEIQRLKSYESAKAEADAVAKIEDEEGNPKLLNLDQFGITKDDKEERTRNYVSSLTTLSSTGSQDPLPFLFEPSAKDEHPSMSPEMALGTHLNMVQGTSSDQKETQDSVQDLPGKIPSRSVPSVAFTQPFSGPASTENQHRAIAEAIAEGMEAARLPTPHLTVFSGDPLGWPTWKVAFETVIEKRATNTNEKMLYLLQYLSGPPKKIVEGYQFVQTGDAYEEAKKILERRFGHPAVVADAFRKRLEGWPKIPPKDGSALREFADFLKTCELAMRCVEDLETLNKQHDNKQLLKVLPGWALPKWGVRVRDYQIKHGDSKFPPFSEFVKFVAEIAEIQCLPVLTNLDTNRFTKDIKARNPKTRFGNRKGDDANTLATGANKGPAPKDERKAACLCCGYRSHDLDSCRDFMKKPRNERIQFIIRKGLCLKCLTHGHMAKENKCESVPSCKKCKQKHPTCLHKENADEAEVQIPKASVSCTGASNAEIIHPDEGDATAKCTSVCSIEGQQLGHDQSLIVPVWVSSSNDDQCVLTYALIDCQSNASFITDQLRETLKVDGVESHLRLSTMHKEDELIQCKKVQCLW